MPQFPGNTNVMVQHIFDNSQCNQDEEDGEEDEQIKRQFNQVFRIKATVFHQMLSEILASQHSILPRRQCYCCA